MTGITWPVQRRHKARSVCREGYFRLARIVRECVYSEYRAAAAKARRRCPAGYTLTYAHVCSRMLILAWSERADAVELVDGVLVLRCCVRPGFSED